MKVLVLGLNYAPEHVGIAVYTTGMAEMLAAKGYAVQVVAGQPYYPAWRIMDGHEAYAYSRGVENGVDVTRVPHYIPRKPTGAKRLLHYASFLFMSSFPVLFRALTWRPDVVLTVAPSLMAAPLARVAAGLCGARSWLHIQDFEVEAAFATGLMADEGRVARLARWFERQVLTRFDTVSAISPQMCAKLFQKGVSQDRIVEFRNWANIDAVKPLKEASPYREEWGIETPHVALYSGNIANKQGIEIVLDAARLLTHRGDLTFVVCGEGPNRANLEAQAKGLGNIRFYDLQPKERLEDLLGLATVHLLPQLATAADLVLPSKLTNMLASGRPVVATAAPGTGLSQEVEGCGLVTPPGDAAAFAAGIESMLDDPSGHAFFCRAARERAENRWSAATVFKSFTTRLGGGPYRPADDGACDVQRARSS